MIEEDNIIGQQNEQVQYDDENIRHLSDMEHVRTRPGMYIGRLGDPDSIAKRIHLKKSGVERVNHLVRKFGGLMGFFTFLPAIGTVICLVLGVMRANPFVVLITSTIGKFLRYAILAYMVFSLAH